MKRLFFLIGFLGLVTLTKAQSPKISQSVEDLLEATGETMSDDTDIQEILDDWERLQENPMNVNTAVKEDFERLHLLSEIQINNLLAYRAKTGTIYSLYELVAVNGFDQELLQKLEPFLSFASSQEQMVKKRASTDIVARMNRTFNPSAQTSQAKYEGSPERYYARLKHVSSRLEYGVVAEKDPGEAFLRKSNKHGFDYNSAFVNFGFGQTNNRLFAGDYNVRFGQGLVAWQGFSMGKSVETTQVFRSAPGIRSYTSTDENQFLRGIAAQLKHRNLTFSPFVSLHNMDASIDTIDGVRYFAALQTSGYHRTNTEIQNEKSLSQFTGGANLTFESGNWAFGGTVLYTRFNAFMDRSDEPYNQFLPEGKSNWVGGIDWKGSLKKIFVFGEGAISQNNGRALITGAMMNLAPNAELSLVYRNINKTYFSYFANAFTESSRVNDEHALYLGFKIYPVSRLTFQAYADFFRFKWIKYTTAAPSDGTEFLAQLSYSPSRATTCYLRFFREDKDQRLIDGRLKYNTQQLINRVRINFTHDLNETISLKSRVECSFYSKLTKEKGFLIFQDVAYRPLQKSFSLNGRLSYFSTDGYNSRLYAYESDLLYSFAVPAFYDRGIRAYFNLQKEFGRKITVWLKLGATHQLSPNDGDEAAESSTKTELKFQIRYHF
jgi:hypothetical protein